MANYREFAEWAGSQAKAARLIGINKFRSHRLFHGNAELRPDEAMRIELASGGIFRKEQLIFGRYVRNGSEVDNDNAQTPEVEGPNEGRDG